MGLFSGKKPTKQQMIEEQVIQETESVFDDQFRGELQDMARQHFQGILDSSAVDLKTDIDTSLSQVTADLKEYMQKQLDLTIAQVNTEVTNQLNERINEYNRLASESQDQANQAFNRNTQLIQEKYQQLAASLQQAVTGQEVAMISVFQDNKTKISSIQNEQEKTLRSLSENAQSSRQQAHQLNMAMQKNISDQSAILSGIYQENITRATEARNAQSSALSTLSQSVEALQQQYRQLGDLLDKSISEQKAMVTELINDNMARIVEHYLVGALGEQSDLQAQLPSILNRLEESKQAMMDDMKL